MYRDNVIQMVWEYDFTQTQQRRQPSGMHGESLADDVTADNVIEWF